MAVTPMRIGAFGLLAALVVGCGSAAGHHAGSNGVSESRISLPGVSVAIPTGWHDLQLPSGGHSVAAAPKLNPPCPNSLFGGQTACQDAVAVAAVPEGSGPEQALQEDSQQRFVAMRKDLVSETVLRRGAVTVGGCPAYMTQWHVTWIRPPATLEEFLVLKTGVSYANTDLESVFIRLADTRTLHPRAEMAAVVSSVHCRA